MTGTAANGRTLNGAMPVSNPANKRTQDVSSDIERIFALQRDHQWAMKATTADERKARLRKLKAAVEAHGDEIVAAVLQDTRKPEGEIRVTELAGVLGNIQKNIDNLEEWMKPVEVVPFLNPDDRAKIVYEARGVRIGRIKHLYRYSAMYLWRETDPGLDSGGP